MKINERLDALTDQGATYSASQILDTLVAYLVTNHEVLESDDLERIIDNTLAFAQCHFKGDTYRRLTTLYPELVRIIQTIH